MRNFLFGGAGGGSLTADLGLLCLRVAAGLGLFTHGMQKMPPPERFVNIVRDLDFPVPLAFAWIASITEFCGSLLLIIGFVVRPTSLAILTTMSTAFFLAHRRDAFSVKEASGLYGAIALAFLLIGGGRFSVDALFRRRTDKIAKRARR